MSKQEVDKEHTIQGMEDILETIALISENIVMLENMLDDDSVVDNKDTGIAMDEVFTTAIKLIGEIEINSVENIKYEECGCHGCCGDGWVENSLGEIKICPICEGNGVIKKEKVYKHNDNRLVYLQYPQYPWYPCVPICPRPGGTGVDYPPYYPTITYSITTSDNTTISNTSND